MYGMSETIGPISLSDEDHDVFLGRDYMQRSSYSEDTARQIDEEVTKILATLYDEAFKLLEGNRSTLDRIAEALLERETLDTADLKLLVDGKQLPPLPSPIAEPSPTERADSQDPKRFPGDGMPDPEPVPG
jgi:cell division protease FtsH